MLGEFYFNDPEALSVEEKPLRAWHTPSLPLLSSSSPLPPSALPLGHNYSYLLSACDPEWDHMSALKCSDSVNETQGINVNSVYRKHDLTYPSSNTAFIVQKDAKQQGAVDMELQSNYWPRRREMSLWSKRKDLKRGVKQAMGNFHCFGNLFFFFFTQCDVWRVWLDLLFSLKVGHMNRQCWMFFCPPQQV